MLLENRSNIVTKKRKELYKPIESTVLLSNDTLLILAEDEKAFPLQFNLSKSICNMTKEISLPFRPRLVLLSTEIIDNKFAGANTGRQESNR
jgi:hypothetical protein